MTGRPASKYCCLSWAIFSNWALRSACCPIVRFFCGLRRRYPCSHSRLDTTFFPAGVPNVFSRREICRRERFVHLTSARIGSPAVWSRSTSRKFSTNCGHVSVSGLRPPLFFVGGVCPTHSEIPFRTFHAESSLGHNPALVRRIRYHHALVLPLRPQHIVADRARSKSHTTETSAVPILQNNCPWLPPEIPTRRNYAIILKSWKYVTLQPSEIGLY